MDLWEQAKFSKVESTNQKQIIEQQPQITKQQDITISPQRESKEAAPENSQIFKCLLLSEKESKTEERKTKTKNRKKGKTIVGIEQSPALGIVPHEALVVKKDEPRVIGAGSTAANIEANDSSEMTELVKLLVKLTDENLQVKQNLQADNLSENKIAKNTIRNISEKEQKMGLMVIPLAESEAEKNDSSMGVNDTTVSVSSHSDASMMTPLVKLLVKLTDEHKKQKSINLNVKKTLLPVQKGAVQFSTSKEATSHEEQIRSSLEPPIHDKKNVTDLVDEARETPENDMRKKKKAELKEKFYAGVEDPNLRKQFDFLLNQEDLNEVIDQMFD